MNETVKALVARCRRDIDRMLTRAQCDDDDMWQRDADDLAHYIAAVEAESAREEAVEHALARRALEATRERIGNCHDRLAKPDDILREGEREIMRQLSLLGARNFEVVEIPQGASCLGCPFVADRTCGNPFGPVGGERWWVEEGRSPWCRSRYGVEAKR